MGAKSKKVPGTTAPSRLSSAGTSSVRPAARRVASYALGLTPVMLMKAWMRSPVRASSVGTPASWSRRAYAMPSSRSGSNPATAMSSGTRIPASRIAIMAPIAIMSLAAKTARGWGEPASSVRIAA